MTLYKYYSPSYLENEERFKTLEEGKFYYSSVEQLNDPFDLYGGKCVLLQYRLLRSWLNTIYEAYSSLTSEEDLNRCVTEVFLILLRNSFQYASCSFSRVPLERLMWAHYAGAHQGFCLEFEFPVNVDMHKVLYVDRLYLGKSSNLAIGTKTMLDIDASIRENVSKFADKRSLYEDSYGDMFSIPTVGEVASGKYKGQKAYVDNMMSLWKSSSKTKRLQNAELIQRMSTMPSTSDCFIDDSLVKSLLCLKSQEWCYEQEERLITKLPLSQDGISIPWGQDVKLQKIILGCKFDKDNVMFQDKIKALKQQYNADTYMVDVTNIESFELSMKRYKL